LWIISKTALGAFLGTPGKSLTHTIHFHLRKKTPSFYWQIEAWFCKLLIARDTMPGHKGKTSSPKICK
jgi:hypothetical protein